MPDDADPRGPEPPSPVPAAAAVEVYETVDGVVLYDAGNPLAWIESRWSVPLDDAL